MRKVIAGIFITMDGVVEEPGNWQETFDDDMMASLVEHTQNTDTILLGRVTYEYWVDYWPTSDFDPFATHINSLPKYVASTTLDAVEWGTYNNISLIKDNLIEEIKRLKQQDGKNIAVEGSPSLVQYLLENEVLDELRLIIHPVVANDGKRLFKSGAVLQRFDLVQSQATESGVIIANYRLRRTRD